ncbi:MAG TPA: cellulase family glycosylhydrolase [Anaerolineae bacterium]
MTQYPWRAVGVLSALLVFAMVALMFQPVHPVAAARPPTKTPASTPTPTSMPPPTPTPPSGTPGGYRVSGNRILDLSGAEFIIAGVNWFGFETRDLVAHGLWSKDYKFLIDRMKQLGFNTIRLPWSNEMWETNPTPRSSSLSGCPECSGKRSRDIMALIVNYAGSVGMHVILDNHRSAKGNSAESNGLWYTSSFPEQNWIDDWVSVLRWINGVLQANDTVTVNYFASDGFPTVIGFDLRNEPHTVCSQTSCDYLGGATWGSGDGIDPHTNPNPNPFTPACVSNSSCHDWRLAAERAGTTIFGEANSQGWDLPLIFVEGISLYPTAGGSQASGPYDGTWWGGNLQGVNGNSTNPGAPVLLNKGGSASGLGAAVNDKVVYSAHDYGPSLFVQPWFNSSTCYKSGCGLSSLADVWKRFWAHLNLTGGVAPHFDGNAYPWANTGHAAITTAPVWIGEFGTANADADLFSTTRGSQGQWFTDLENFILSSYNRTTANDPGFALTSLHWTYWAINADDSAHAVLDSDWSTVKNPKKIDTHLCSIEKSPFAVQCTGTLSDPF